jgi:hypothetical protein
MAEAFTELQELSNLLNEHSDKLNAAIDCANQRLAKMNLGVPAWLGKPIVYSEPVQSTLEMSGVEEPTIVRTGTEFGYCRVGGKWQLAVRDVLLYHETSDDDRAYERAAPPEEPIPLLNASREVRASAVQHLPQLLKILKEKAAELLENIRQAEMRATKL